MLKLTTLAGHLQLVDRSMAHVVAGRPSTTSGTDCESTEGLVTNVTLVANQLAWWWWK